MLVSVIVPTLNEADHLRGCVRAILANSPPVEIIVADGGSVDATVRVAATYSGTVRVVTVPRGRARQMNAGAAEARGELLWFVHADTLVPRTGADLIRRRLTEPDVALGAFALGFRNDEGTGAFERFVARGANLRSRLFRLPFGDQAFFLRRTVFERMGGFPDVPILEDLLLARSARRLGRVVVERLPVWTSARRWHAARWPFLVTATHALILAGYALGCSTETLARWRHSAGHQLLGTRIGQQQEPS